MSGYGTTTVVGDKHSSFPDVKYSGGRKAMSTFERCFVAMTIVFFVTTIIFLGLFVYYIIRYHEIESEVKSICSHGGCARSVLGGCSVRSETDSKSDDSTAARVCDTPECVVAAAQMLTKMDSTADPCTDFNEYACGRFNREAVIPEGSVYTGTFSIITQENQLIMKEIIMKEPEPAEPGYLQNMKRLYASCADEDQIEVNGLSSFLSDIDFGKDWPTLNPNWQQDTFNLNDVIAHYQTRYIEPLFASSVGLDYANSSLKVVFLSDPKLGMSQEYYSRPKSDPVILAYQTYLREIAVTLGANRSTAEQDAWDIIDLETALAKIMLSATDRRNFNIINNPVTMGQLSAMYPDIAVSRAIRTAFDAANVRLSDNQRVINLYPTYMGNLSRTIASFSNRVLQNVFGFRYALSRVQELTNRLREIQLVFDKVYRGQTENTPRWQHCLNEASTVFWKGMSKQFVNRTFTEQAKVYMGELIDNLMTNFRVMLKESSWMGMETKEAAYKKLAAMKRKIGYPDVDFTDEDINQRYKEYKMLANDYYGNRVLIIKLAKLEARASLTKPIDKNEWKIPPHHTNAYYSVSDNEIAFPAGVLQSPLFSQTYQDYVNYASIGMVIAHEITHGFDYQGSQFDLNGNLVNWWSASDRQIYLERSQCVIDQYSRFLVDSLNTHLNGPLGQGENVADNGGLKESYRAYRERVRTRGEQSTLPGLYLTQDQLFFLAYGQLWCEKQTKESLLSQVTSGTHAPGKYRIIGALQNSADFAKAFKCPLGSYMNPKTKCVVW